jgi:hypothetical protein
MKSEHLILGIVGLLLAAAFFLPSNSLTGHIVKDEGCGPLGCSELCDQTGQVSVCGDGYVCCPTNWETGVCDYRQNCEKIREYSLSQSLATYQDSVREAPAPVNADIRSFFIPLAITLAIIGYFVMQKK